MNIDSANRFMDKNMEPTILQINDLLGKTAVNRLTDFEVFLNNNYNLTRELKFPFGNNYGWGYKYSCKGKLLCYVFFEKGAFTVTITIGKNEVNKLYQKLDEMLPKTKELWANRYPCGAGGWIHYQVEDNIQLLDVEKLIIIKKN